MKAVIYARYSSYSQREESIDGQLRECRAFAEKNNIVILGTYVDRAISARSDDRPDFQRMIKDADKEAFDTIIVQDSFHVQLQRRRENYYTQRCSRVRACRRTKKRKQ